MSMEENKNGQQEMDESEEEENNQNNNGGTDEGSGNEGNGGEGSGANEETKSYTQKQLNKMMAREKNQGRNAALRELGIDPKDSKTISLLQSILKGTGQDQSTAENDQKVAEANKRALIAEVKAEAMQQGAQPNFVDDIVTLVINKMDGDDEVDIQTIVAEFKTKYSTWFTKDESDGGENKKTGQKGTGSSVKGKGTKKDENDQNNLGKRLAAQRKAHNPNKKSFWG